MNNNGKICNGSCLAATLIGYYSGNTINDADVYTNQRYKFTSLGEADGCSGEFYIEGIMVHEVGHVIGIDIPMSPARPCTRGGILSDNGPASLSLTTSPQKRSL